MRFSFAFQLMILISVLWSVNGLLGFYKGRSFIYREPPFTDYTRSSKAVVLEHIEQLVDNFDPLNKNTYKMRYYRNDEFFKPGSPVIIYVGGEWTIYAASLLSGRIYELAKDFQAQLFYTEHRYYGSSYPTENASTENLKYLSVDQALADLAHFIDVIKKEPGKENSPIVIVGGSYSATMVAWFKKQYPKLAVGAWASSAPLLAKVDFIEYKEIVGAAIRHVGGEKCYQIVNNAIQQAEDLIKNSRFDEFKDAFQLCDSFNGSNILHVWSAFGSMSNAWSGIVQYHREGDIEFYCDWLVELASRPNLTDIEAFGLWLRGYFKEEECLEIDYENDIKWYKELSWNSSATVSSARQWLYQTCSEFGWYQTSGSMYQPFGSSFPVDLYYQLCYDIYGLDKTSVDNAIEKKNLIYDGWNLNVDHVYFTHGQVDPWRTMGIQATLNETALAAVIDGASHCQDLNALNPYDNEEMHTVKLKIKELIQEWIKQT